MQIWINDPAGTRLNCNRTEGRVLIPHSDPMGSVERRQMSLAAADIPTEAGSVAASSAVTLIYAIDGSSFPVTESWDCSPTSL